MKSPLDDAHMRLMLLMGCQASMLGEEHGTLNSGRSTDLHTAATTQACLQCNASGLQPAIIGSAAGYVKSRNHHPAMPPPPPPPTEMASTVPDARHIQKALGPRVCRVLGSGLGVTKHACTTP